ncbi:hypothetical protein [Kitasatospora sp. NPDC001175]
MLDAGRVGIEHRAALRTKESLAVLRVHRDVIVFPTVDASGSAVT